MKLDDFEAVFRSSVKERFHLDIPVIRSALIITDLPEEQAKALESQVKAFLEPSMSYSSAADNESGAVDITWRTVCEGEFDSVKELLDLVAAEDPGLIICYRHLLGRDKDLPHSLGSFVDSVTQIAKPPVLLLPPLSRPDFADRLRAPDRVLVVTDHLIGDDRLVNWGLYVCRLDGTVVLAHVEDDTTFARYMEILSMVPDADTETLTERFRKKLLGRPADYIQSTIEALQEAGIDETVEPVVTMGHALSDYRRIIDAHNIDLIVLNTRDEQQLAMAGMAYAIAIEILDRPLLLL